MVLQHAVHDGEEPVFEWGDDQRAACDELYDLMATLPPAEQPWSSDLDRLADAVHDQTSSMDDVTAATWVAKHPDIWDHLDAHTRPRHDHSESTVQQPSATDQLEQPVRLLAHVVRRLLKTSVRPSTVKDAQRNDRFDR